MLGLEYEAFGVRFPGRHGWDGLTGAAKERQVGACIDIHEKTVERYQWDALLALWLWCAPDGVLAAKNALGEDLLVLPRTWRAGRRLHLRYVEHHLPRHAARAL